MLEATSGPPNLSPVQSSANFKVSLDYLRPFSVEIQKTSRIELSGILYQSLTTFMVSFFQLVVVVWVFDPDWMPGA